MSPWILYRNLHSGDFHDNMALSDIPIRLCYKPLLGFIANINVCWVLWSVMKNNGWQPVWHSVTVNACSSGCRFLTVEFGVLMSLNFLLAFSTSPLLKETVKNPQLAIYSRCCGERWENGSNVNLFNRDTTCHLFFTYLGFTRFLHDFLFQTWSQRRRPPWCAGLILTDHHSHSPLITFNTLHCRALSTWTWASVSYWGLLL